MRLESGLRATLCTVVVLGGLGSSLIGCRSEPTAAPTPRVVILGFDGMDYTLTQQLMAEGRMPNLAKLAAAGHFQALGTSVPPQSPVAWSDFITGLDSGGHGIFDFVHRDPATLVPYLSTSRAHDAENLVKLGKYQFPLSGGGVELLRYGTPFWQRLEEQGIPTTIVRMPADFPPSGTASRELSGMGTPDILGTYGTFSFYTSELFFDDDVAGGDIHEAWPEDGVVRATLFGPTNPFLQKKEKVQVDFEVYLDPDEPVVELVIGDERRILMLGEWSDWVPLELELIPTQTLPGMARFYLKQLEPEFQLYVSPVNFDPLNAAMPISHPAAYAQELAEASGRYYTQGMPEDTQAFKGKILSREEFLAQATMAREEMFEQYRHVLGDFEQGLLFYYMGSADQISHMLWDTLDPTHPQYDPEVHPALADVIPSVYARLDEMVGLTLERLGPDDTLAVMSDHGFTSWKRTFHLNAWLVDNGYLVLGDPARRAAKGFFSGVDWSKSRAYGMGINGLYLNLAGREKNGIVPPGERLALMREIHDKLLAVVDPATGEPAITKVYSRDEDFHDRGHEEVGPDLVVGYAKGTRCSGDSSIGGIPEQVFEDNTDDWPGDHLMDHETVPGILATNRPLARPVTNLRELAPAILAGFGVEGFPARQTQ